MAPQNVPDWYVQTDSWESISSNKAHPHIPLLHQDWSSSFLTDVVAQPDPNGPIDLGQCIEAIASGRPLTTLPRLTQPTLRYGIQLLIDTSDAMLLFRTDQENVIRQITKLYSSEKVEILYFDECPSRGVYAVDTNKLHPYHAPPADCLVLILSDMGMAQPPLQLDRVYLSEWTEFLNDLDNLGLLVTLLTPYPSDRLPQSIRVRANHVYWDRRKLNSTSSLGVSWKPGASAEQLLAEFKAEYPGAYQLAVYSSLAVRIEPQLLRTIRLQLLPDVDAGSESDLWFGTLVVSRSAMFALLRTDTAALLRRELDETALDAAWEVLHTWRKRSVQPQSLIVEETILYYSLKNNESSLDSIVYWLRRTLKTLREQGNKDRGLLRWATNAMSAVAQFIPRDDIKELAQLVKTAADLRLPSRHITIGQLDIRTINWLLPNDLPDTNVSVNLLKNGVRFSDSADQNALTFSVPDTTPRVIQIISDNNTVKLELERGQSIFYPTELETIRIQTIAGHLYRLSVLNMSEEQFAQALFDRYPKTRGTIAIKFPVFTGRSGSSVWQVEISEQNNHPGGAAYAKVDALIRCQKERDRHTLAKDHPHMRQYIPEIIFPRATSQTIQVDGQTFVIYQPALGMIRTLSLSDVLRDRRYTMRDEAEVIKHLIDPVLASWYQAAHTAPMHSFDLAAEFTRLFDLGEEDLDPASRRSAGLSGRLKEYFDLEDTVQRLIFDRPDATVSLPNPVYFLPRLADLLTERQRSISLPALPMHGDLHTGNIICALSARGQLNIDMPPTLIDFAQYEEEGFLFFDLAYLELSILMDSLPAEMLTEVGECYTLLTFITQGVLPEGQPESRDAEAIWILIAPLRTYVESLLEAVELRSAGVHQHFETAWWFAAAVAGLRFTRRRTISGGQRSAALFYAGAAMEHLRHLLSLRYTNDSKIIMNWTDHIGFRAEGMSLPAPRNPIRGSSLPQPPQMFVAHPYTLTQFIGRADELDLLKNWAASADPIMVIEAIGGQGKSALTWHWLHNHASKDISRFAGAMWWSFYESDGAIDNFIAHALAYVTDTPLREVKQFAREERERMLLAALKQRPFLLVMDGLERILKAYYTTKAAHLTDDEIEAVNRRGEKNDRACVNPLDGRFLEALLKVAPSKILISTRLLPLSLEARSSDVQQGVQHKRLAGLSDNDALALMRHYNIKGNGEQIKEFTHQFGNHGLILGVIAGQINNYRPAPGDFDKWYVARGKEMQVYNADLRQRQSHILEFAFANLDEDALRLLQQIAVFRYPIDYDILAAINPFTERHYTAPSPHSPARQAEYEAKKAEYKVASEKYQKAKSGSKTKEKWAQKRDELQEILNVLDEEQKRAEYQAKDFARRRAEPDLDRALHLLEERGLVLSDVRQNLYDLHPIIRAYTYERLDPERRKEMVEGKKTVFESRMETDTAQVTELHHLYRELEIYHALLASELWNTAWEFYHVNLHSVLFYRLGSYYEIVELLLPLLDNAQTNTNKNYLSILATVLDYIDVTRALYIRDIALKISLAEKDILAIAVELMNLSQIYADTNHFYSSIWVSDRVALLLLYTSEENPFYYEEINYYAIIGQWEQVNVAFLMANEQQIDDYWKAIIEIPYRKMLMAIGGSKEAVVGDLEKLAQYMNNVYALRELYHMRGEVALNYGDGIEAEQFFQEFERLCLKSRISTKAALGGQARALVLQGKLDRARDLVESGIDVTSAAEVWLAVNESNRAKAAAVAAYREAWGDGPPYALWWELQRAKKVLETLNEPLPDMPPFDPANRERIPYEDEFIAFVEELEAKHAEEEAAKAANPAGDDKSDEDIEEDAAIRGTASIDFPRVKAPRPVGQRWALLVGANQYADPNLGPLNFCANDVQQIGQALEQAQFSLLILNDQQSDKSRQPSSENVREALTHLQKTANPNDLLWLHFSCHGELVNGEASLIFANTRQRTEPQILRIREIENMFRDFKHVLITLDACHVGVEGGRGADDTAFIRNVHESAENFAVLAASTSQQRAAEWQDQRMGVFSYYLLNGIQGAADRSGRGFITVNDLAYHVLNGVRRWSWRQGGILQDPTYSIHGIGDIVVVDYRHT